MKRYISFDNFEFLYTVTKEVKGQKQAKEKANEFFLRLDQIPDIKKTGIYSNYYTKGSIQYFCQKEQISCPKWVDDEL